MNKILLILLIILIAISLHLCGKIAHKTIEQTYGMQQNYEKTIIQEMVKIQTH